MPMHDWTRTSAGTFHDFHNSWITHIKEALNDGLLPQPYYALGEQPAGDYGPDVLALKAADADLVEFAKSSETYGNMVAVEVSPPRVYKTQAAIDDIHFYLERQRAVTIRHTSGDRVIAMIEIVSPANRHSQKTLTDFADKVITCLQQGIHVVIIDPFPHGANDPEGIHDFIWRLMMAGEYTGLHGKPLTMVSYTAGRPITAWIEAYAVGDPLASMPLFLTRDHYIPLPLESTYGLTWKGVPQRWKNVILGIGKASKGV